MLLPDELGRQRQQQVQQQMQLNSQVFSMRAGLSKEVFMLYLTLAWHSQGAEVGEEWKTAGVEANGDGKEEEGDCDGFGLDVEAIAVDAVGAADALLKALGFTVKQGESKE